MANHRDAVVQFPAGQQRNDRFLSQLLEVVARHAAGNHDNVLGFVERQFAQREWGFVGGPWRPATAPKSRWSCGCSFNQKYLSTRSYEVFQPHSTGRALTSFRRSGSILPWNRCFDRWERKPVRTVRLPFSRPRTIGRQHLLVSLLASQHRVDPTNRSPAMGDQPMPERCV